MRKASKYRSLGGLSGGLRDEGCPRTARAVRRDELDWAHMDTRTITVAIPEDQARVLERWLEHTREGGNTHGSITLATLAAMLLEDASLATTRSGSWEGSAMGALLRSHGYDVFALADLAEE